MIPIDDHKLMTICAEEVTSPTFLLNDFHDLLSDIGQATNQAVQVCIVAIALYNEVKKALQFKFSGSRVVFRKDSVCRAFERYLDQD